MKRARKQQSVPYNDGWKFKGEVTSTTKIATATNETEAVPGVEPGAMKLEVVALGVADVDRAKAFYENLGWRLDADIARGDDFRVVQLTPPGSECSIWIGKGIMLAKPGSADSLILAVYDIDAARDDLVARVVNVSEVFHRAEDNSLVGGRDPEGRSYASFASFKDPDGNGWLLQEITTRRHSDLRRKL